MYIRLKHIRVHRGRFTWYNLVADVGDKFEILVTDFQYDGLVSTSSKGRQLGCNPLDEKIFSVLLLIANMMPKSEIKNYETLLIGNRN